MEVYWIGVEDDVSPQGYGDDYRYYATVKNPDERGERIRSALGFLLNDLHFDCIPPGLRIAIRLCKSPSPAATSEPKRTMGT